MKLDSEGIDFLVGFEKVRYRAYPDRAGHSTGIGHYILPNEAWMLTATLTPAMVKQIFAKDCFVLEEELNRLLVKHNIKLKQSEYNAIFDLYYNVGMGKFLASNMLMALQSGDKLKIEEAFLALSKGIPSILERRMKEFQYFCS